MPLRLAAPLASLCVASACSWTVYPEVNAIWGQVAGPDAGPTGCESGDAHPCWAKQTPCASCTPVMPPHSFIELGKATTFEACMKLGDAGWGDWPASAGEKPATGCHLVGWGDASPTNGIPGYMNEQ